MSSRFEHEIILEESGQSESAEPYGVRGIVIGVLLGGIVLLALLVGGRAVATWVGGLTGFGGAEETAEVVPGTLVQIEVPGGASARQIASILVESGVIASSADFEGAVQLRNAANQLKAGGYEFVTGAEVGEILDVLIEGPNLTTFRVTIIEGRRIGEVIGDLARQTGFEEEDFVGALSSGNVQSIYLPEGIGGVQAWEGLLFPDTYEFFGDATPPEILQRLANETERRLSQIDWTALRDGGFTTYQALVISSMVEAEAGVDSDRPLIASVIFNRLEAGMLLQIDATVLYALGERGEGLTIEDLTFESPYNTYVSLTLPPTPIGTVGFRSLEAVALPAETDFIYYVLTSLDGSHTFTVTYDEFLAAKEQAKTDGIFP